MAPISHWSSLASWSLHRQENINNNVRGHNSGGGLWEEMEMEMEKAAWGCGGGQQFQTRLDSLSIRGEGRAFAVWVVHLSLRPHTDTFFFLVRVLRKVSSKRKPLTDSNKKPQANLSNSAKTLTVIDRQH